MLIAPPTDKSQQLVSDNELHCVRDDLKNTVARRLSNIRYQMQRDREILKSHKIYPDDRDAQDGQEEF